MPTYEYKCSACGEAFEKFQSIVADPIKKCPACGKNKAQRLISAGAGLIFKGSGFYITDYRDAGYKKDQAAADSSNNSGSTETKTDAKPSTDTPAAATASKSDTPAAKTETPKPAPKPESKPAARSDSKKSNKK